MAVSSFSHAGTASRNSDQERKTGRHENQQAAFGSDDHRCSGGGHSRTVSAASAQANLPISVTVANNCTITALAVGFPNYDPIVTHATTPDNSTSGSVTITCTKGSTTTIGLSLGANFTGTQARMLNGTANYLNYGLYQDAAHTIVWGNAAPNLYTPPAAQARPRAPIPSTHRFPPRRTSRPACTPTQSSPPSTFDFDRETPTQRRRTPHDEQDREARTQPHPHCSSHSLSAGPTRPRQHCQRAPSPSQQLLPRLAR